MDFDAQFRACSDKEQAQKLYRELSKQYHPDLGGDTETMKEINRAYELWASNRAGSTSDPLERAIMRRLQDLLSLNLPDNVKVELIGSWIWVSGDTRPHKTQLKNLGMTWHAKRKMWYWTANVKRRIYNSKVEIDEIRATYGSKVFNNTNSGVVTV